ncbi:alpha/beta fold hydrolase [Geminicoccus flavidas]|uniref:alpha/beta fold hydrolase n=1 Tax=Geminicoccus flavidas TaxID=2506407 RepID=UPI001359D5D3|nr:alpha/beta hydrolase [Geminicoccus flavidas]
MDAAAAGAGVWVETVHGRLHAQCWPASDAGPARPPIVLLHDSLGCVELWRDFPGRLATATGRRVIAYDRLGFGRPDRHPGRLGPDFVVEEASGGLAAVLARFGIGHFVAFGHSIGAGMAIAAASAHPGTCQGVISESAQALVEERTLAGIRAAQQQFARPGQMARLERYHGAKAAWVLDAWTGTWLSPEWAGWNLDAELRAASCPILAIHGEDDEYGSARHPERIAALAGGPVTVRLLPRCGHVPHREQEPDVLWAIAAFLA